MPRFNTKNKSENYGDNFLYSKGVDDIIVTKNSNNSISTFIKQDTRELPLLKFTKEKNLLGHWIMDDGSGTSISDSSVNNNTGTINNGGSWVVTRMGYSLFIDGENDYVNIPNTNPSSYIRDNFTVSIWIYAINDPTDTGDSVILRIGDTCILNWKNSNASYEQSWAINNNLGTLEYKKYTTTLEKNIWYNLSCTFNRETGIFKTFLNGKLETTTSSLSQLYDVSNTNIGIGCNSSLANFFEGYVRNLRIYDIELSETEITKIYTSENQIQNSKNILKNNLIAHWKLNDGLGTAVLDSSDYNNTGTMTNMEVSDWVSGPNNIGYCLDFDGTNDYVNVGATSQTMKSISFWIYADDITSRSIIDLNGTDYVEINASSLINHVGTWTGLIEYINGSVSSSAIIANTWYHIAATVTSSISVSAFKIGLANSNYFDGKMSDIRIYDRVLSANDIKLLYDTSLNNNEEFKLVKNITNVYPIETRVFSSQYGLTDVDGNLISNIGPVRKDALVAHWKLDEGLGLNNFDLSGYGNNGIMTNMDKNTDWVSGPNNIGYALDFDGTNDYINLSNSGTSGNILYDIGTSSHSVCAWINLNTLNTTKAIIAKVYDASYKSFSMHITSSNAISFGTEHAANNDGYTTSNQIIKKTGVWYHVAYTAEYGYDEANPLRGHIKIYINGAEVAGTYESNTYVATTTSTTTLQQLVNIGRWAGTYNSNYFNGKMGDIRIYNTKLSANEVSQIYKNGVNNGFNNEIRDTPIAQWKLNEGNGSIIYDNSGNGKHGIMNNMDPFTDYVVEETVNDYVAEETVNDYCLDFDGTNDYITINNVSQSIYSITFWIYADSVVSRDIINLNGTQYIQINASSLINHVGTWSGLKEYINGVVNTGSITAGIWYHIAATVTTRISVTHPKIGYRTTYFDGKIYDVRLYNKTLTQQEIYSIYNKTKPPSDLVAHWKFMEGTGLIAHDSSVNRNNGTLTNMDSVTDWVSGPNNIGYALDFDGVNDHITIANSGTSGNVLYDIGTSTHSICFWVNFNALSTQQVLIGKDYNANYRSFTFLINVNNQIVFGTENNGNNDQYYQTTATISQTGVWYHVGYTVEYRYDEANPLRGRVRLYINGAEVAGTYADNSFVATTTNTTTLQQLVNIGRWGGTLNSTYFNGKMSDIRIYKKALSTNEISQIYNDTKNINNYIPSPKNLLDINDKINNKINNNLLLHYTGQDNSSSTYVTDYSGNRHHAKINNATYSDTQSITAGTYSLSFDGTGDYIEADGTLNNSIAFKGLKSNEPFTLTAWVYTTDLATTRPIYSSGEPNDDNYLNIYIDSDEKIRLSSTSSGETYIIFNTALTTGAWNHITITRDTINSSTNIHDGNITCYLGNETTPPSINYYNTQEEINLNTDLVGHWRLNEGSGTSITDLSGYGNTGTMNNMDAGTDWVSGPYGMEYSLDFDGANDHITIANSGTSGNILYDLGKYSHSICLWVKFNVLGTNQVLIGKDLNSSQRSFTFVISGGNQLTFATEDNGNNDYYRETVTSITETGVWYHVGYTVEYGYDVSYPLRGHVKMYINGAEVVGNYQSNTYVATTADVDTLEQVVNIGRWGGTINSAYLNGNLSDIRIYNKVLSANEVKEIYKLNHVSSRVTNRTLIGHWKLDEGTGTSIYDYSTIGTTGTINGNPTWTIGRNGIGKSLEFDGDGDYVSFGPTSETMKSISFWIYPHNVVSKSIINLNLNDYIEINGSSVINHVGTWTGLVQYINGSVSSYALTANTWYHIAATVTSLMATSNVSIGQANSNFFDGKIEDVRIFSNTLNADEIKSLCNPNIRIGKGAIGSHIESNEFNGYLDDIRLYKKKLTYQEIKGIWNNGNGSYSDYLTQTYNCVAKYDLSTGSGTIAYDKSGNNYNITLSNSALWTTNTKIGLNALNFDDTTQYTAYFTPTSNEKIITASMWVCIDKLRLHTLIGSKVSGSSMANGDFSLTLEVKNGKNLVGHWVLDEGTGTSIGDSSNNSNTGTLSNGTWSSGINYKCVDFNGTSTNISIGDTTQSMKTISFWIYADNVVSKSIIDLNGTNYIQINGSSLINHEGTWTDLVEYIDGKTSTSTITTGKWYHIVSTVSSSISVSNLNIGLANSNYFDGKISDVRIYDNTLTAQDVYELYTESIHQYLNLTVKINNIETNVVSTKPLELSINTNKWYHISFIYYSSNIIELYINGVRDIIKKINISQSLNLTNGVYIGSKYINSSTKNYLDGRLCDLQLYKIKLDAKTIDNIHRGLYECVLRLSSINPNLKNTTIYPTSAYNLPTKNCGYNSITLDMFGFTPSTINSGITGTDFTFNGFGRYIRLNDDNYLSIIKHRVFTIMGWIKVDSTGSGTEQYLFSKYKDTGSGTTYTNVNYYKITIDEDNSTLNFTVFSNNSPVTINTIITKDTFVHFACVCEGEYKKIKIYINGIFASGANITTIDAKNTRGIEIGRNFDSTTSANYYNGKLSDLRFYETALTSDTIQKIMNEGEGKNILTNFNNTSYNTNSLLKNGLIGHWELNQARGSYVYDTSGYRNKGTLTNMDPSTDWISGRNNIGYCLDFDGTDDYITTTGFTSGSTNTVTFSFWCYPEAITTNDGIIFSRNSNTNATGVNITDFTLTNNIPRLGYYWNNTENSYTWPYGPKVETAKWQHFTVVITSTDAKFYKNGEYYSSNTLAHSAINITDIDIGYDNAGRIFNGRLLDVRIYNRSLSANEVKLLYNGSYDISKKFTFKSLGDNNNVTTQHIQKYTIDNKNNTTIPLVNIARDNIVIYYDFEIINGINVKDKSTSYKPKLIYNNFNLTGSIAKCISADLNTLTLADKHKLNRGSTSSNISAGRYDNRKIKMISGSSYGKTFNISRTHNDGKLSLIQITPTTGDEYMLDYKLNISPNDGILNSASLISNNSFFGNKSIKLNGSTDSTDYLTINTNSEIFLINNDTQFTAIISIKPSKNNNRLTEYIWTKTINGNLSSQNACALIIDEDVIKFIFRDKNNFYNDTILNSKHIIDRTKWTHIAVSKGYSNLKKNILSMYIDGVFKNKIKLNNQLVGHWKLDEGSGSIAYDSSNEYNNGTLNNFDGGDWLTGFNSKGYCLDFDGTNDNITIANSGTSGNILYDLGTSSHSICLWVKFDVLSTQQVLIGKDLNYDYRSFTFLINANNQILFGTENNGNNDQYYQTTATISQTGVWYHVAYAVEYGYDLANPLRGHVKLYINGAEVAGTYESNTYVVTTENTTTLQQLVNIGRWGGTLNSTYFNGQMSDIRIYKGALSAQQIQNIFIENVPENILKAEYKLIEGLGTTINDTSGNSNNGTLTNGDVTNNWVVGRNNQGACISLDGTNDYISVGDISTSIYSVSCWVYIDSIEDNNPGSVLDLNGNEILSVYKYLGVASYVSNLGTWTNLVRYINGVSGASSLVVGEWNHIVSTVTSAISVSNLKIGNSGTYYFNGKISDVKLYNITLTASQVKNLYENNNKNVIEIGRGYNGLSYQYTDAYIDEFRFYDTKLNDFEIYKLSQQEKKIGPLIHYTFDKGSGTIVEDLGSEGIPLKLVNDATYSSSSAIGDYCLSLDGTGDYAIANYTGVLGSNPRTISFWFKRLNTDNIATSWDYLLDYGVAIDNKRFSIALEHDTEFLVVSTKTNDSSGNGALVYGSSIQDTKWHHCVVMLLPTYKYADGIRIYLDGKNNVKSILNIDSEINTSKSSSLTTDWLVLGGSSTTLGTKNFAGYIDDFRMYNVALTEDEIQKLYYNSKNYKRISLS